MSHPLKLDPRPVIITFLFGPEPDSPPNIEIGDRACKLKDDLFKRSPVMASQVYEGEVRVFYRAGHYEGEHQKKCLGTDEVMTKILAILERDGLNLNLCYFYILTHDDHDYAWWLFEKRKLKGEWVKCTSKYDPSSSQWRCRKRWRFLLWGIVVKAIYRMKKLI